MKCIFFSFLTLGFATTLGFCQRGPIESFPLSSVTLLESPFRQAQQTDLQYILSLDPDRLLAPYLMDAGMEHHAKRYPNWEDTGLDGHIGGHYLSALSLMYAATADKKVEQRLAYMVDQLAQAQKKNGHGYVGGIPDGQAVWQEIRQGNIDAGSFSLNDRWVPLYNIHKTFAGLHDAYRVAGNEQAKEVLVQLTDWFLDLTADLSDEQIQDMLRSEHGGLNEVFAEVADITGEEKYLTLAQRFSHKVILDPLLQHEDKLTGLHANTQIPKVVGYQRIAEVAGDQAWSDAARFFWETVVNHRTVSIGGNSVREHFHPTNDFLPMIESEQGPETCNTYNMLRLTKLLFLSRPEAKYMDYYERALYNHILSSQHPTKGGFVYFTPMRPRHYRVYSQPQESFWCCVGSGLENHGKYGELIYAHDEQDVYVNLFIPSRLTWKEKGITVTQKNDFPFEASTELTLALKQPQTFAMYIRHPTWVPANEFELRINGEVQEIAASASSYAKVERAWQDGDVVSVKLPMHTELEYLPDGSPWASFVHGPMVLAAATEDSDLTGLWADSSRMGHVAAGPLYPIVEAPMIVKDDQQIVSELKPVPGEPLAFTASTLIEPKPYADVKLVPFFTLHETRYQLYWPVTTPEGREEQKTAIRERENEMLKLEAQTVDQVATGEQQPESDHNFQGKNTQTGMYNGWFWRDATGWFSYDLKDESKEGKTLRVTYYGGDKDRMFDIYLNDNLLTTVHLDGSRGNTFFHENYDLPSEMLEDLSGDTFTVKFKAHEGSIAGGIYYVRLLK